MKIRAQLIELWNRVIDYDKRNDVYLNGKDNLYPNEMERVVQNSPTANRSAAMMSKYIAGQGVEGEDPVVNKKKHYRLSDIIKFIADDVAVQGGCFIHVGWGIGDGGALVQKQLSVLDYVRCRIGKEDDNENEGKIWVKNYEKKKSWGRQYDNEAKWFYPYNPNLDVVLSQINNDTEDESADFLTKLQNYRGQVFYLNLTPRYRYAISTFDGVFNDMDTEYRMSLYANGVTRGGFLGKTAVLTQGLDKEKEDDILDDIGKWLGAENASSIYHLAVEQAEDLDNILKIIQIPSQYDDNMFVNTDKRIRRNISGAANNIPEGLIYSTDGALFGTSGEAYQQMKEFYSEQTQEERRTIERALKRLGFECAIVPFEYTEEEEEENEEEENENENENDDNNGDNSNTD